jgi:uncharacterized protein YecT (DUF1311 family)
MKIITICILFFNLFFRANHCIANECTQYETTVDRNECLQQLFEKIDLELNETYKHALILAEKIDQENNELNTEYKSEVKANLIQAQRNWVKYKEHDCSAKSDTYQGSISGVIHYECLIEKTESRIYDLKYYINY